MREVLVASGASEDWVGLHARSVVAAPIDGDPGEVFRARMGGKAPEILAWIPIAAWAGESGA